MFTFAQTSFRNLCEIKFFGMLSEGHAVWQNMHGVRPPKTRIKMFILDITHTARRLTTSQGNRSYTCSKRPQYEGAFPPRLPERGETRTFLDSLSFNILWYWTWLSVWNVTLVEKRSWREYFFPTSVWSEQGCHCQFLKVTEIVRAWQVQRVWYLKLMGTF